MKNDSYSIFSIAFSFLVILFFVMAKQDFNNSVDWSLCVLCQKNTTEVLKSPDQNTVKDKVGAGYYTLANNILQFHKIGSLPLSIDIKQLDEGNGIAATFTKRKAKWHKSCYNKFNTLKLQRAEKRKHDEDTCSLRPSKITRRSSRFGSFNIKTCCFVCSDDSGTLHKVLTFNMDSKIRSHSLQLNDSALLARISGGDLISQDAVYHAQCLVSLFNRARSTTNVNDNHESNISKGIALAQLIEYIENARVEDVDKIHVFKLADLTKMYSERLRQLGEDCCSRVNSTHLKNRILEAVPGLQAHNQGKDVVLAFNDDLGEALKVLNEKQDFENEAAILLKTAKIIRRDILNSTCHFDGTYEVECQCDAVPESLKTLVSMILDAPDIKTQSSSNTEAQTTLSVSQLILYNTIKRRRSKQNISPIYHSSDREPPLPVYLGLMIHAETRKRGLVDELYKLGLSISYDRVLEISTEMGNKVCARYESEKVVCPHKLKKDLFTTAAVDNIDHDPSSTTAKGSLHGTGISLFQHVSEDNPGQKRNKIDVVVNNEILNPLPESYTNVKPAVLTKPEPAVPPISNVRLPSPGDAISSAFDVEYQWLDHVKACLNQEITNDVLDMSWAAFHASKAVAERSVQQDISSMLPLFQEEAHSVAMIRHAMDVVSQAVSFLNPGQIPVLTCDQPLFAIAKKIQWNWPDKYGEDKLVVMFGGLHTEAAGLKALGTWLDGSGWTNALVQAEVTTPGTADSFLKASHISRTLHAHQVTSGALNVLMDKAYENYCKSLSVDVIPLEYTKWRKQREEESPQFLYWSLTLKLELTLFIFVRSLREGNFQLYKEACATLAPWFFALNHTNYARWLPVHLRDMESLDTKAPLIDAEFRKGHFVVQKSHRAFSSIPIDQAHEQNNKIVKGDGGVIGLTENSSQLQRWMVSGPEISRIINEFRASDEIKNEKINEDPDRSHHEQNVSVQATYQKQVKSLCATIEEMGNPFLEQSKDLLVLDTRNIMDPSVVKTVKTIEELGKTQYQDFVSSRLEKQTTPLFEPVKRNSLCLFSSPPQGKQKSKSKMQITSLKNNCSLFSRLYVSYQVRNGDLDSFFSHENQSFPPSLTNFGELRSGTKSDLLPCLEKICPGVCEQPSVDALLLDGAALVNMLNPGPSKTFEDYSQSVFLPYIEIQLHKSQRVDVVWDVYLEDSLKAITRAKRGTGIRRRVRPDSKIPSNWQAFLRIDENKQELFQYLADQLASINAQHGKVVSTKRDYIVCNRENHGGILSPCSHEEADTRLLLHTADVARCGFQKVMLRTVDTDVVVIAIATFHDLYISELWVAFGTGKHFRYIPVHDLASRLGRRKSKALLMFHAFTGCDQTSAFKNIGKKTAWDAWLAYEQVTEAFYLLSTAPSPQALSDTLPVLERFTVVMYDRTSSCVTVNSARKDLFTRKGREIDNIPPTSDALLQHAKRAVLQSGFCWGNCLEPLLDVPPPDQWGWARNTDQIWEPLWLTMQPAAESCQELLKCGCKSERGCTGRCKCVRAELPCTALCYCGGQCGRA